MLAVTQALTAFPVSFRLHVSHGTRCSASRISTRGRRGTTMLSPRHRHKLPSTSTAVFPTVRLAPWLHDVWMCLLSVAAVVRVRVQASSQRRRTRGGHTVN